jgi:hypothetical protein
MADKFDPATMIPPEHQAVIKERLVDAARSQKIKDPRRVREYIGILFNSYSQDQYKQDVADGIFNEQPREPLGVDIPEVPMMATSLPDEHLARAWGFFIRLAFKKRIPFKFHEEFALNAVSLYIKKNYREDLKSGVFFIADAELTIPRELLDVEG